MSVIIRPVREAVELTVGKALNARVLSRPMIAEIVAAGVNAIEADPIGYLTYYNTRAGTGSVVLAGIEDHIEQLRRAAASSSCVEPANEPQPGSILVTSTSRPAMA